MVYAFVEGKYDCCLYPKFFNLSMVSFEFVGGGKGQVELALIKLQDITKQVFGICDADFRHLTKEYPIISNLFLTDCHDIEMTMLNDNQTLNNAFTEYCMQSNAANILQEAINGSVFAGYTRWYNDINTIKLKFNSVSVNSYYDIAQKIFNSISFLNDLDRKSPNKSANVNFNDITNFEKAKMTNDIFNLCNGHDVITLLVVIIKNILKKNISIESFCSVLRASFILSSFKITKLYSDIFAWQTTNCYSILL
ncbi:hypothetical protein AGMMS50267_16680 [Spirochaetia bacterium]|nr:hypothetical protein AGMMS50267_16680 [Spirochaetia bacterium]